MKKLFPPSFFRFWETTYLSKSNSDFEITEFFFQSGLQRNNNFFYERTQMCIYGNLVKFSKKGDNFDQINFESILV